MQAIKLTWNANSGQAVSEDIVDAILDSKYPEMLNICRRNVRHGIMKENLRVNFDNQQAYFLFDSVEKRQLFFLEFEPWFNDAAQTLLSNQISMIAEFVEIEDVDSLGEIETITVE
jgi:hypothetical protein